MNKAVHVLVYLVLVLAVVALVFELQLFNKRMLLGERNKMFEDYVVKISRTVETDDAAKAAAPLQAKKDISPVEAKLVESPETENLLEEYPAHLEETANRKTFEWDNSQYRVQLRQLYLLDSMGEPVIDAANYGRPTTKGPGTMRELLDKLFDRCKAQQATLNTTRAALKDLREKYEQLTDDHNKLKPPFREALVKIEELKAKIAQLESEKAELEDQVAKLKAQIEDLNAEITSLKDEVTTAKEETEAVKEELAKSEKLVDQLKKMLAAATAQASTTGAGSVTSLSAGPKGTIVTANNKLMFAIVEFSDAAMKEMLGPERQNALPQLELAVRRKGLDGVAGEFVGKVRLRQLVAGKNFVVADIIGDWLQTPAAVGDIIYAE